AAYVAFLKGQALISGPAPIWSQLRGAADYFEQAVALDSTFAQAWSGLAQSLAAYYTSGVPTPPDLARRVEDAAERAVRLAPNEVDGYLARAAYQRAFRNDLAGALAQLEMADRVAPQDPRVLT